mmetsp:Transcript_12698/g.27010  ORF Transcript_12698/g.27010 Transcript_12698/m.27010 type:complete len:173 (+) Transcript_12698:634-1152(+)
MLSAMGKPDPMGWETETVAWAGREVSQPLLSVFFDEEFPGGGGGGRGFVRAGGRVGFGGLLGGGADGFGGRAGGGAGDGEKEGLGVGGGIGGEDLDVLARVEEVVAVGDVDFEGDAGAGRAGLDVGRHGAGGPDGFGAPAHEEAAGRRDGMAAGKDARGVSGGGDWGRDVAL